MLRLNLWGVFWVEFARRTLGELDYANKISKNLLRDTILLFKMVLELTDKTFQTEVIKSNIPVIVDFWAPWCGPCKMMAPVFEELSKDYAGKLKFAKINTDDFSEMAIQNQITGIPCLIVFKNGEEADRIVGFLQKAGLKGKIDEILAKL